MKHKNCEFSFEQNQNHLNWIRRSKVMVKYQEGVQMTAQCNCAINDLDSNFDWVEILINKIHRKEVCRGLNHLSNRGSIKSFRVISRELCSFFLDLLS